MSAPLLEGVRVLDLTNVLAGPYAGYQLALMGADVLKVENPRGGDLARRLGADPGLAAEGLGISFLAQNAQKRSIALDLKDEQDLAVFRALVRTHDVVLENFRPGVMDRLGIGWEPLREINPALVYCAISGFGQSGPMRDRPAYDQIVQGMSGLMSVTGSAESGPTRVGAPISDSIGGMVAAFAVSAALVRRARTGEGALLDVSMLEATLTAMGWVVSDHLVAGRVPAPMGNENRTAAPSGTFETADGQLNIAANKQEQFEALCEAIGRPWLVDDPRFHEREVRKANRDALKRELEDALAARTATAWDTILLAVGVPAAPVVAVGAALASAQVAARGLVADLPSPSQHGGTLPVLGSPVHVDGEPVSPSQPPPRLDEHGPAVRDELAATHDRTARA